MKSFAIHFGLLALLTLSLSAYHSARKTQHDFKTGDTIYIEKPNGEVEMKVIQKVGR